MIRWLALFLLLLTVAPGYASAAPAKRLTLPNGVRLLLKSNWSTDVVAIELLLDVSAEEEPAEKQGMRYLVQRLLLRGTISETGHSMARRLAAVGGIANTTVGLDYVEIYALVPAEGFETALEILADSVRHPAFSPEEVDKQKTDTQELARAARDEPFQETYLAFRESLYPSHPYGTLTLGIPSQLASISRDDIVRFHREHYLPNRAVIAICGGVGEARAMRSLRKALGDWPEGSPKRRPALPAVALRTSEIAARERHLRRAHLILGFPAPAADETDYYIVQVIDSILSGGATARLPLKLRDELGLVYTVSSFYPTLAYDSHLGIYAVTEPHHLGIVKSAIIDVLDDLVRRRVSQKELSRAKAYLLGSYALSHQRMKEQAYSLAWYEVLGLGVDFEDRYVEAIHSVTPEQVQKAADRILSRFVLAVTVPTT